MKNYVLMRLLLVWKLKSCFTINIQFVSFYDDDEKSKKTLKNKIKCFYAFATCLEIEELCYSKHSICFIL